MGYKAAVQVLKQAEELKVKVSSKCDWLNNAEAWTNQQKLQTIYHQVLVLDLEYALDKKVEQDLWNIGFKNHISSLQELARDKKNPNRSDCQALLTWALEAASGFYITLLQELCNTFDVDLPFRRRGSVFGQTTRNSELTDLPQTSSCLYICQYCLVHLGDISRYRNQRIQAESFYKQAILVSPTSGHPYNQLALLEASQGNKLSTVFYYIRGIAVKNPFPASVTNLSSTLNSTIDKECIQPDKIQTKMTVNEFVQLFMCTHAYFHTCSELKQAELSVKSLNSVMTALVATQSFTKDDLMKISSINLYSLDRLGSVRKELTKDEKKVRELVLDLIAGSLSALLMPVHTLKMDEGLMDYYALPAVKLLLYFIQNEPDVLKEKVFTSRLQIWPSLVKLLNNVLKHLKGFNFNKYSKYPLPEDKDLQGFLPLSKNFKEFDFKEGIDDIKVERLVRMKRIVNISSWLTETDVNGSKLVVKSEKDGEINFEPVCIQPDPTNDLLEEMKSFSIVKNSENNEKKGMERKTGILKPQGSLEKSREERELLSSSTSVDLTSTVSNMFNSNPINNRIDPKTKKGKQNIALQSIFRKMEENNKQVKFIVDEPPDKDRPAKFDPPPALPPPLQPQPHPFAQPPPLRPPPTFNPSFATSNPPPSSTSQPDYLTALRNMPNLQMEGQTALRNMSNLQMEGQTAHRNMQMEGQTALRQIPNMQIEGQGYQYGSKKDGGQMGQASRYQKGPPLGYHPAQQGGYVQAAMPYQNVSLPPSHPFNAWSHRGAAIEQEVPPMPNPAWWQNTAPPPPAANYRPDYLAFPPAYPPSNYTPMQQAKPQGGGDIFKSGGGDVFKSPWSNSYAGGGATMGYEKGAATAANQGMSIRQAMLKEGGAQGAAVGPPGSNLTRISNPPSQDTTFVHQQPPANPGYSLFNNSWTPNLAGQLRGSKPPTEAAMGGHLPQQSLFSGHGPKSLAQLLEQQSQLNKHDL
ncbi:unnamed protein product [Phaedon cochleariae]|uniref:Protein SMG7 n=1 Tax=Phaedon cochleariae TaxID=80249 RepID=A0A9N9X168_PHACE|nr:unnamed protein product [Phaedon cochleariae]